MDITALNRLLEIEPPWTVRDCQWSSNGKRVEIAIGVHVPKTWFGQARAPANEVVRRWRHVNIGVTQCHIRAHIPRGMPPGKQPWVVNGDLGMSHAMTKQIFAMLSEGVDYGAICNLLEIPFQDLWKFKFALDSGKAGVEHRGAAAQPAVPPDAAPAFAALPDPTPPTPAPQGANLDTVVPGDAVPDVTDPIWQHLAEGRINLDIRMLSLKLLLTRVRSQMEVIHDREVRLSKLRELHRYFLKNERVLGHEIAQLHSVN